MIITFTMNLNLHNASYRKCGKSMTFENYMLPMTCRCCRHDAQIEKHYHPNNPQGNLIQETPIDSILNDPIKANNLADKVSTENQILENINATNIYLLNDLSANNINLLGDIVATDAQFTRNLKINNNLVTRNIFSDTCHINNFLQTNVIQTPIISSKTDITFMVDGMHRINVPNLGYGVREQTSGIIEPMDIRTTKIFIIDRNTILNADIKCNGIEITLYNNSACEVIIRDHSSVVHQLDSQCSVSLIYLFPVDKWIQS